MTDVRNHLPVITECFEGCGACCNQQSSPPGYVAVVAGAWRDQDDIERVRNLPEQARVELDAYMQTEMKDGQPCIWLDLDTRRCRFYEHRPSICRDFEVGSDACLQWIMNEGLVKKGFA